MNWYDERQARPRWLAYFDLLGTRILVQEGRMREVHDAYIRAIEAVRASIPEAPLHHLWFSDTFIILADDDSGQSFAWIDLLARRFMYELILHEIPVRGAISCDKVYENRSESVLFGPGLIEAYDYGEDQDWIGLVLTPSSEECLRAFGIPASKRLNYAQFRGSRHHKFPEGDQLYACILGNWYRVNGQNPLLERLLRMKSRQHEPEIVAKYERTCEFLSENLGRFPEIK